MANTFEIFKQTDKETAAAEAGEYLNALLLENKDKPVLLLLSGGSSFSLLEYISPKVFGQHLTISVLDERFSQDPAINNFSQLQKQDFFKDALEADSNFFGTLPRPEETIESLAERWEKNLRDWKEKNPNGIIVATLGMGADGHTSGILPFPEDAKTFNELFNGQKLVTAYNAGNKNQYPERVTTTIPFLKWIDFGFGFVCGLEKKPKLDAVITNLGKVNELPALAWHEVKNFKVFTNI